MSRNLRSALIAFVTFIAGLYFFLEFVLPEQLPTPFGTLEFGYYHDEISRGVQIVSFMAIGLGLLNILSVHGGNLIKMKKGWGNSLALLLGLFVMFAVEGIDFVNSVQRVTVWEEYQHLATFSEKVLTEDGANPDIAAGRLATITPLLNGEPGEQSEFLQDGEAVTPESYNELQTNQLEINTRLEQLIAAYRGETSPEERPALHQQLEEDLREQALVAKTISQENYESLGMRRTAKFLFGSFFVPLGSAMFSLLAFYIAAAAYRTFRIRSLEAGIMMLAALVVMLGQIPHGPIYISEDLPAIRLWILEYLSTPAFRAIYFGSMIAGLAMATRMWLSLERSPLASFDDE